MVPNLGVLDDLQEDRDFRSLALLFFFITPPFLKVSQPDIESASVETPNIYALNQSLKIGSSPKKKKCKYHLYNLICLLLRILPRKTGI